MPVGNELPPLPPELAAAIQPRKDDGDTFEFKQLVRCPECNSLDIGCALSLGGDYRATLCFGCKHMWKELR